MRNIVSRRIASLEKYLKPYAKTRLSPKDRAVASLGIAEQAKKAAENAIASAKIELIDLGFDCSKLGDGNHILHDSEILSLEASICAVGGRLTEDTLRDALKKRGYSTATVNAIVGDAKTGSTTRTTLKVTEK